MPSNRQFSNRSRGYSRCCGILSDWSQCSIELTRGNACCDHVDQARWLKASHISPSHRVAHARNRRCSGLIKNNSRLCNNRKAPFTFCHHHVDQGPPVWTLPSTLPYSDDAQHAQLRDMILDFVSGALGPQRNHFGEQARREEEKERQRRQEERARRERKEKEERQHRQWEEQEYRRRQWEEHERQRRQWEEQDRQRRQKEEQDREHRQREQRSSESGHRRSKRTDPPVPIDIARAEYAQRLSALRASLENPNPNRLHTFADIPWPTRILKPTVDNVTPDRVQEFFVALKKVSSQTMMEELKDARILFHPSRFMAWGVYTKLYWDVEEVEVVKLKVEEVSKKLNDLMDGQRRQAVRLVL